MWLKKKDILQKRSLKPDEKNITYILTIFSAIIVRTSSTSSNLITTQSSHWISNKYLIFAMDP